MASHHNLYRYFNKFHTNEIVEVKRKQKIGERAFIQYPKYIAKYTENIGCVDQNDQMRQYYNIRVCRQKYYLYIAYFSIGVTITNAYIFHCLLSEPTFYNMKDFYLNLATLVIASYNI